LVFSYNEIQEKERKVSALVQIEKELDEKIKSQELRIKELELASSPKSIKSECT